ncbi:apolipoprotein N-acyltransferase [Alphaproteobacteria bacterium]|nr:apolipoprotein N-acyltransferase [Alphaproteobacteria bacterium]
MIMFLAGLLASLSFPPLYLFPALLFGFALMGRRAVEAKSARRAVVQGAWFGAGLFVGGTSWIVVPLTMFGWDFVWLIAPAVIVFGLWGSLAGAAASAAYRRWPCASVGAAVWTLAEWVRGWLLTGFPWNPAGSAWAFSDAMLQPAAYVGTYGLTFLTVLAALLLAPRASRPARLAACAAVLSAWFGLGHMRLAGAEDFVTTGVSLRIVQPNVSVRDKHTVELGEKILARLVRLSREGGLASTTHVIWPETAAPFIMKREGFQADMMYRAVPPSGYLLTGAITQDAEGRMFNSIVAMDNGGDLVARYDKSHLVPFGEYVPGRAWLGGLVDKVVPGSQDFTAGAGIKTLALNRTPPFSPLVCYEVIFPAHVADYHYKPAWLLNVVNDGWYGRSAAPYQHLAAARARAVEEGTPLVRAANTGISAVIDGYGRLIASLPLGEEGILDSPLPAPLSGATWYNEWGDLAPLALMVAFILLTWALGAVKNRLKGQFAARLGGR